MNEEGITILFASPTEVNPYHPLLFEALEQRDIEPITMSLPIFLPLTRAVLRNDAIDAIHMDWFYRFYIIRDLTPFATLNTILTAGRACWLCIDLLLIKLMGTHFVWTVHNKYHHERYYFRLERILNIIVANLSDRLVVMCETARETISESYRIRDPTKIAVIPHGNYIGAYPNSVERDQSRTRLGIGDEFVYLYFGQIQPYKGVEQLIEAFQQFERKDSELWIAGNPSTQSMEDRIRARADQDDRVQTNLHYIPDEDVQYYMNAADILVFPYQDILNSGSAYLGMSFGKPIIAPNIGCIPETLPSESNILFNPAREGSLIQALADARELDTSEAGAENLRQAKSHDWSRGAERYQEIYPSV